MWHTNNYTANANIHKETIVNARMSVEHQKARTEPGTIDISLGGLRRLGNSPMFREILFQSLVRAYRYCTSFRDILTKAYDKIKRERDIFRFIAIDRLV
jgi:hypothetical protein